MFSIFVEIKLIDMKISEIKDTGLRELAEKRRKEDGEDNDTLSMAFHWGETPERAVFWCDVDREIITELPKEDLNRRIDILKKTIEDYKELLKVKDNRLAKVIGYNEELIKML